MTYLSIKWSKSKAQRSFGADCVTLTDTSTWRNFVATGHTSGLVAVAVAQWLTTMYQLPLLDISHRSADSTDNNPTLVLRGLRYCIKPGSSAYDYVYIDRETELHAVLAIAEAINMVVDPVCKIYSDTPTIIGFMVDSINQAVTGTHKQDEKRNARR